MRKPIVGEMFREPAIDCDIEIIEVTDTHFKFEWHYDNGRTSESDWWKHIEYERMTQEGGIWKPLDKPIEAEEL